MERGRFGRTEARVRQDKQEGGEGEDKGMCGDGRTWRGETGRATICPRVTPVSAARATTGPICVSREAKPEPAAAEGDVDVDAGERAEEGGYDSTLLGHQHPGRYRQSGMDTRQRPLGAPSRTRSPRWGSHSQPDLEAPRTALPSCPSSSLQTPTKDQDQPDPLTKLGTLHTQPRTWIQANERTRRSTRELVHAYLVC